MRHTFRSHLLREEAEEAEGGGGVCRPESTGHHHLFGVQGSGQRVVGTQKVSGGRRGTNTRDHRPPPPPSGGAQCAVPALCEK